VLYESAPGQVAVKAMKAYQSGRRSKDVTTWRGGWVRSGLLFRSLLPSARLPFALRGSSGEAITGEAWGLGPGEVS
jgi:hypothetical protein